MVFEKCKKGQPPLKRTKLSKKSQERDDLIKKKLLQSNRWWNDWKFQYIGTCLNGLIQNQPPKNYHLLRKRFSLVFHPFPSFQIPYFHLSVFKNTNQQYPMDSI